MNRSPVSFRRVIPLSLVLGAGVGLFCAAFYEAWHHVHVFLWSRLPDPGVRIAVSGLAGLAIGLILTRLWDPGTMSDIVRHFHRHGALAPEDNKPMLPVSLIGLVGGSSAGPEGVLTQVGGSLGTFIARTSKRVELTRILTLAGMGAGFGAFLGAPIGGAILWLELPHRKGLEYYEALIPTLTASLAGYVVLASLLDLNLLPTWPLAPFAMASPKFLWESLAIGTLAGMAAMLYTQIFRITGLAFTGLRAPLWVKTTLTGLAIGTLGAAFPLTYFYGRSEIGPLMAADVSATFLLGMLLAKMLAASLTIKGHWQGGLIIPHMFMGATLGKLLAMVWPAVPAELAMVCGMAAFNAAATHTPLASPLIVLALTGFGASAPVFLASLVGFFIGQRLDLIGHKSHRAIDGAVTPAQAESAAT